MLSMAQSTLVRGGVAGKLNWSLFILPVRYIFMFLFVPISHGWRYLQLFSLHRTHVLFSSTHCDMHYRPVPIRDMECFFSVGQSFCHDELRPQTLSGTDNWPHASPSPGTAAVQTGASLLRSPSLSASLGLTRECSDFSLDVRWMGTLHERAA